MTREQRLTLFLGKCWHEYKKISEYTWKCQCGSIVSNPAYGLPHRTFLTWEDMGDVKDELVERGLWDEFDSFMEKTWYSNCNLLTYSSYILQPQRFCDLADEFLMGLEGKDERSNNGSNLQSK